MRRITLLGLITLFTLPVIASAETFKNVSVVDVNCSQKVAADPDSHPRSCALQCQQSGFGIITPDDKFLKLDAKGNAQVLEALKNSQQKDHLRVDVSGDVHNDTLVVKSIKLL